MNRQIKVFSGRVIFDHIAKTAGTAINAWLRQALGAGCVTEPVVGEHRKLISRYGGYSIIFGHIGFGGEGLDPRYQYVTLLRHPVERLVSWLYFVINCHTSEQLQKEWGWEIWEATKAFVESEGEVLLDHRLFWAISNWLVRHFASIFNPNPASDEEELALALSAIAQYDLIGVYEELPRFTECLASRLGLLPPNLPQVNITKGKPAQVSPKLWQRLEEKNQLDLEFYSQVKAQVAKLPKSEPIEQPKWQAWPGFRERRVQAPLVESVYAELEGETFQRGEMLRFSLEFSLTEKVGEIEPGIHIFDEVGRWVFGTNTTLLGQPQCEIGPGSYRIRWYVVADLPPGRYTAGFALADRSQGLKELFWRDALLTFRVLPAARRSPSVGWADLPVGFVFTEKAQIKEPTLKY